MLHIPPTFSTAAYLMQNAKLSGHILVMVLLLMVLMSLLVLQQYQQILLNTRAHGQRQNRYRYKNQLLIVANTLSTKPTKDLKCIYPHWQRLQASNFKKRTLVCRIEYNHQRYSYYWEYLSVNTCLQITKGEASALYRISLKKTHETTVLQAYFIFNGQSSNCEPKNIHKINPGKVAFQFRSL